MVRTRNAYTPGSLREAESSDEEDAQPEGEEGGAGKPKRARKEFKEPKAPQTPEALAPLAPGAAMPIAPRRKKAAGGGVAAAPGEVSLMELLAKHPEEAGCAAKAWVARYSGDQTTATAELLTLLVQAAGAAYVVSNDDVEEGDADGLATRLRDMVMEDGGFEPFLNKRTAKGMKAGFPSFWLAFVEELHGAERLVSPTTGNTDDFALEKVKDLAVALSVQAVRSFRLAATLCASQLVSSMVGVRKQLLEALAQVIQQRDAEQKKGARANKSTLASIQRQVDSYHRQDDSLNAWVDSLIKPVFAVRFRDVTPSIRALVISSFGQWIKIGPATFLSDAYLKYLGWALSDRDMLVRSAAIAALRDLYANQNNAAGMREFKGRFLGRMMELPYDVSDSVAVAGMGLLATLVQLQEVDHAQMHEVYGLLADESPFIREAAATLAAKMLKAESEARAKGEQGPSTAGKASKGEKKGTQAAGQQQRTEHATDVAVLLDVMAWMQRGAASFQADAASPLSPQAVNLLVDSLYDCFPAVRDGSALAIILGDDESLGPVHVAHAAMLLAASLQRAQHGSTAGKSKRMAPRAKAAAPSSSAHQDASLSLIGSLPSLIRKHQTQAAVVAPLCQAVRLLRLELFALRNEERAYGDLLNLVADQVFRHTDFQVAVQVVDTLIFCSKMGPGALQSVARLVLSAVVNKASQGLASAACAVLKLSGQALRAEVEELESAGGGVAPEGAATLWRLKVSLTRVQALICRGAWSVSNQAINVWGTLSQLLDRCGSEGCEGLMGVEVVGQIVHAAHATVMAGLALLKQAPEEGQVLEAPASQIPADDQAGGSGSMRPAHASENKKGRAKKTRGRKRPAAAEGVEEEEEEQQQQGAERGHAIGGISVDRINAQANALAQQLVALFDVAEALPVIQVVVSRAMIDLLTLLGPNVWKGTSLEGCRLEVDAALLERCWLGCDVTLRLPQDALLSVDAIDSQERALGEEDVEQSVNNKCQAMKRRLLAVGGIARLLLAPALLPEQKDMLAIRLMARFTAYGPQVEETVRDVAMELRRRKHQSLEQAPGAQEGRGLNMAELNVEVLKHSYEDVLAVLEEDAEGLEQQEPDMECLSQALYAFNETASAVASMYAGAGLSRDELVSLVRGGARFALAAGTDDLTAAMHRMYFLAWGLEPFIPKLLPQDAASLVGGVEQLAADVAATPGVPSMRAETDRQEGEEGGINAEWMQYAHFMGELKDQASKVEGGKGRGRGAMRGTRAHKLAVSPPPASRSPLPSKQTSPASEQLQRRQQQPEGSEEEQEEQQQTQQDRQRQQRPTSFSRKHSAPPHALADEEPFDMGGTLLDYIQLPRKPLVQGRQEALSRGAGQQEVEEEEQEKAEEEGAEEGDAGFDTALGAASQAAPSQGTQATMQTTDEPPPRVMRRRRV